VNSAVTARGSFRIKIHLWTLAALIWPIKKAAIGRQLWTVLPFFTVNFPDCDELQKQPG
jgi:hypothetical protein